MTKMKMRRNILIVALWIVLHSGCAVGPNYKRPTVPVPPAYRGVSAEQARKPDVASFGDEKWWDAFQDETLRDLIRTALKQNYDVQIAATPATPLSGSPAELALLRTMADAHVDQLTADALNDESSRWYASCRAIREAGSQLVERANEAGEPRPDVCRVCFSSSGPERQVSEKSSRSQ